MRFFGRLTHVAATLPMPVASTALPASSPAVAARQAGKRRVQRARKSGMVHHGLARGTEHA